jgi:hypothetical protein
MIFITNNIEINKIKLWLDNLNFINSKNEKSKKTCKQNESQLMANVAGSPATAVGDITNPLGTASIPLAMSIIVSGPESINKVDIINSILKEYNYIPKNINPNILKDCKTDDIDEDYNIFSNNVCSKLTNKKFALVFSNVENITLPTKRKYIINLHKRNNKLKCFPIIFITNGIHSKLINVLKNQSISYEFNIPTYDDVYVYVKKYLNDKNIYLEDENIINKLIHLSESNNNKLFTLLDLCVESCTNNNLLKSEYINCIENNIIKDSISHELYDSIEILINSEFKGYEYIMQMHDSEKVLQPLMIYENYIYKNNIVEKDILDISDILSISDVIDRKIYTNQNWYFQNIRGFLSCVYPSYKLSDNKINGLELRFSGDLNKASIKNINKKNIRLLKEVIGNKSNDEIFLINHLIYHYITMNKIKELSKTINSYKDKVDIRLLDLLLKIDKTEDKSIIESRLKKIINKI